MTKCFRYRGRWHEKATNDRLDRQYAEQLSKPDFTNFPCEASCPDVREAMSKALPCRCSSRDLTPCSDLRTPPTLAIACMSCEEIEGDAPDIEQAVSRWNA